MLGVLEAIWDAISLVIQFAANMIVSLVNLILMIPTYLAYLLSLTAVVPAFATVFFAGGITLTVVLFMLNRTE